MIASLLILVALRVNSVPRIAVFEYTGETSPDAISTWNIFVDRIQHHGALPDAGARSDRRLQPVSAQRVLDVLGQDFIRTARAKGLTRRQAWSNTVCTPRADPDGDAVRLRGWAAWSPARCSSKIFGWHGMGEWFVQGCTVHQRHRGDGGLLRRDGAAGRCCRI